MAQHPPRVAWTAFPDVILLAAEMAVKRYPGYFQAKAGDAISARTLVEAFVNETGVAAIQELIVAISEHGFPVLVSAHAYEQQGVNAIPSALATLLSEHLQLTVETTIVQTNIVSHTGASGYGRLARQARFAGEVEENCEYLLVDDFVGQGGTLANLRGWVERQKGKVVGAIALTGKPYSAKLQPSKEQLYELRQRHGRHFEAWWHEHFGHTFDYLTQSEARYLARSPDAGRIRDRLAEEK